MLDLLTSKELQAILQVDRTTIYRMADSGRLPAIKIGGQWRFPRQQIHQWLHQQSAGPAASTLVSSFGSQPAADIFPLECVQLIQDSFADSLGVMVVAVELNGDPFTEASNPCGLWRAVTASPTARGRCAETWLGLLHNSHSPTGWITTPMGLLCAAGFIRAYGEPRALLVLGGIAPADWPPAPAAVEEMAATFDLPAAHLAQEIQQVHRLTPAEQSRVLPFAQRIADIFSHIVQERLELAGRLQRIAEITQLR